MSDRYCAWIRIGGSVKRTRVQRLIALIRLGWGEPTLEPQTVEDLRNARQKGRN
jgi:hypothetical protein